MRIASIHADDLALRFGYSVVPPKMKAKNEETDPYPTRQLLRGWGPVYATLRIYRRTFGQVIAKYLPGHGPAARPCGRTCVRNRGISGPRT
jgi:hypothetical protein